MSIREKQDGEDLVLVVKDRAFGSSEVEALRINGSTGKMSGAGNKKIVAWNKDAADGAAANTTAEHIVHRAVEAMKILSVKYIPDAALTANDTTYATLTVAKRDTAGGNSVTLAQETTQTVAGTGSGSWSQFVAVDIPLSSSAVAAGEVISIAIAKASTGVVVPAGQLVIEYQVA